MAEISETIARANLANIVRKLKAGKTLSSAERAAVQTDSINGKELSEMIGCGTRHLINLEKTGVIKKTGYGEWALRESVKGFCAYQRAQIEAKGENVYDEAKTRKMVADADISEIEAAKADGRWELAYPPQSAAVPHDDLKAALDADPDILQTFRKLDAANRFAIIYRVHQAKTAEKRAAKIAELLAMLRRGETIHPRRGKSNPKP